MISFELQVGKSIVIGDGEGVIIVTLVGIHRDLTKHDLAKLRVATPRDVLVYHKTMSHGAASRGRVVAGWRGDSILSRQKNQSIIIGNDIEVTLAEIGRDTAEIRINAPSGTSILDQEIYEGLRHERRAWNHAPEVMVR